MILKVVGVSKRVTTADQTLVLLDDINFSVNAGESLAIVGASGAGKSTLLGLLAGLDLPTSGEIMLDGQSLSSLDEDGRAQLRSEKVGFVFQAFQLLPNLTAIENVMLPLELAGRKDALEAAKAELARVELSQRLSHYPKQLSGGEQQRVAIARAFVTRPKLLFADEPTGNLDSKTGEHVIDLIFELNRAESTTLILVTHDNKLAGRCGRIIELEAGRLTEGSR